MKKTTRRVIGLLVITLCVALIAGCGAEENNTDPENDSDVSDVNEDLSNLTMEDLMKDVYEDYNLEEYISLPDYMNLELEVVEEEEVTDEKVQAAYEAKLLEAGTVENITSGTIAKDDEVNLDFEAKLEDGSSIPALTASDYNMILSDTSLFLDGLKGKNIGEETEFTFDFPDTYYAIPEVAGHVVTFKATVNYKVERTPIDAKDADFDLDSVREELEKQAKDDMIALQKKKLFNAIETKTHMEQLSPPDVVTLVNDYTDDSYKKIAETYNVDWENFRINYMAYPTEEDYFIALLSNAREVVKQETIATQIARNEGISFTEAELEEYMLTVFKEKGFDSFEAFEAENGYSVYQYAVENRLPQNLLKQKVIDYVYEAVK